MEIFAQKFDHSRLYSPEAVIKLLKHGTNIKLLLNKKNKFYLKLIGDFIRSLILPMNFEIIYLLMGNLIYLLMGNLHPQGQINLVQPYLLRQIR